MILLSKDETVMRAAYPVLVGVAAAGSDEPLDREVFEGGYDTVHEADLAARRSNTARAMSQTMSQRGNR